jgi:hypothetical protein
LSGTSKCSIVPKRQKQLHRGQVSVQLPIDDLRERLAAIEHAVDKGAYVPGPWQQLIADLRQVPLGVRAALADDVGRISRKLHLRRQRYSVSVTAGLCIEAFAGVFGGILLALGIADASDALTIVAMILWVSSFQPLIKVAGGTALGVRYEYAYLFGRVEPRFKTDFGSYLALSAWERMIFHLFGTLGSPLGAALIAVIADERLRVAAWVSWTIFWIIIAINAVAFLAGLIGVSRIRGFRIADASGALAAVELRSALSGAD